MVALNKVHGILDSTKLLVETIVGMQFGFNKQNSDLSYLMTLN
jgi:hypothetical protein